MLTSVVSIGPPDVPHIDLVTDIAADPEVSFDVSLDVGVHLAASPAQRIVGGVRAGRMRLGDHVTWSARHFGVGWRMTSKIVEYQRPHTFTDAMQRGPFGHWRHQHSFEKTDFGTRMIDHVTFASPLGTLGRIVDALVLERYMADLLRDHNRHVREVAEGAFPGESAARRGDPTTTGQRAGGSVYVVGTGRAIIQCEPSAVMEFDLDVNSLPALARSRHPSRSRSHEAPARDSDVTH